MPTEDTTYQNVSFSDESRLEEFKRFFRERKRPDESFSAAEEIRLSMWLRLDVERTIDDVVDWEFTNERDKRAWVRQAIRDQVRRETSE